MLSKRLLASTLMIGALVGGLALDVYVLHMDLCFMLIVSLLMLGGAHEFYGLAENEGIKPFRRWGMAGCLLLLWLEWASLPHGALPVAGQPAPGVPLPAFLANPLPTLVLPLALAGFIIVSFLLAMRRSDLQGALRDLSVTVMGVMYVWFLCGFMVAIRHIGAGGIDFDGGPLYPESYLWIGCGQRMVVAVVIAAKAVDTGGYTVGKLIGRHKLIPTVSPGKTVEGVAGGMVFAVAGIAILKGLGFLPELSWLQATLFALIVGFAGMLGDLAESVLKRSSATKDAGSTIPGFGGVLDVIDSFMFACPVALLMLWIFLGRA